MDWTKAKTILIIALIFTNLFLILTYGFKGHDDSVATDDSALIQVLESKNIYLQTEIPKKHRNMSALTVEHTDIDEDEVKALLSQQKAVGTEEKDSAYIEAAGDFINYIGAMTEHVQFDEVIRLDDKVTVSYKCQINEYSVEESYIRCIFEGGRLKSFDRLWIEPTHLSKKKTSTISAAVALVTFMAEQTEEEKIYVENMEMVYWVADTSYESQTTITDTAFPAWKITYNDGKKAYIDAIER